MQDETQDCSKIVSNVLSRTTDDQHGVGPSRRLSQHGGSAASKLQAYTQSLLTSLQSTVTGIRTVLFLPLDQIQDPQIHTMVFR